ncbi:hypothetical protein [Kitasatospora sp. MMS16-BH015]|uniref:hypothetical protein n=1 Tax=Kitasatospora sp. MMS16-BH015 TaxID=2018025 RepID=UPI000CF1DAA0|nr:hypothetical protein [Kitasatospora sp. MMS16-BH015]
MAPGQGRPGRGWQKVAELGVMVGEGGARSCATCGAGVRAYQYRFHPMGSRQFERCIGFAWCPDCRVYVSALVHVPREQVLVDALADLPAGERERLERSETRLVAYLDRTSRRAGGAGR